MVDFPFTEKGDVRKFDSAVNEYHLKWHWDAEDRTIIPLHCTDWQFQFDNELPQSIEKGISIFVKTGTFHRLIKGTGDLFLEIIK